MKNTDWHFANQCFFLYGIMHFIVQKLHLVLKIFSQLVFCLILQVKIMKSNEITQELVKLQDESYRAFQSKLIPGIPFDKVIGVRTPDLKRLAKNLVKKSKEDQKFSLLLQTFLSNLPHDYFDENQIHSFLICEEKNFENCLRQIEAFLPYIDNWATCDQLSPKVFKRLENTEALLPFINKWIKSGKTYTVRFAIGLLMQYFLDEKFKSEYMELVVSACSDEYYVKMMVAWYFATALAKQYDAAVSILKEKRLEKWTHNKAIQKAIESYRITSEQKEYLRTLKQ